MKSFFGKYLGHLAAYVSSGVGIVAAINPTFLPPVGKLAVAGAALAIAIGHHAYTAGKLQAVVDATNAVIAKPAVAAALLLALAVPFGMTGCATVQGFFTSPEAPVVITVSVDVAVAAAEQNGVKASDINAIAKIALAADSGTSATLSTIAGVANAEITKLNLPALDVAAANALEAVISAAVTQKLAGNADLATAQADVAQVLQAVIAATGG